ncbi:glycosyltransferase involved in cell wall biosynthesis [Actinomycetospora succinea]|uniref:Glycosyltransferase involved in cell wall biosynthesis n=1 Tax=Actinomycetospora succinea TaxID=663603 RepID=A0A4R6VI61_9PSEU|nr:GT4 family glycosyltransferase PelF [Actinomycetospora succinea]TDQ61034.1 glycosyltransferase involved in cell wall biosynthesis [Actinomycetospora succinea]
MKVALVTEGTYPIHAGGVSDWCAQLVRSLPEIDFEVVALSGSGRETATYTPPPNVAAVRRIGLWAEPARPRRPRPPGRRFLRTYTDLLDAMLLGGLAAPRDFEHAVRTLRDMARTVDLTEALRSQEAVDLVLEVTAALPELTPTLADALAVTDLVEHFLRPLQLPAPRADLVHCTVNGPAMLLGICAAWEHGTPVLLSEHGVYLRERLMATRRSGAGRAERAALHGFYAALTGLGYRRADAVLPVSGFNARWALQGGARPDAVRLLPNGVDPAGLAPLATEPDVPTLVYAGRIDPLKDLHTLLAAFARVRLAVPGARLRLFGGVPAGNEGYRASCDALVAELGLGDAVVFEGPISPVRRAFEAGHVVVLSSVSEGLPLTVIEAAMCGRPVVATDVGGVAEAVGHGGIVVPAGHVAAFADACVELLTDASLRRELARAGRDHARRRFTLDRFRTDIRAIYAHHTGSAAAPAPHGLAPAPSDEGRTVEEVGRGWA